MIDWEQILIREGAEADQRLAAMRDHADEFGAAMETAAQAVCELLVLLKFLGVEDSQCAGTVTAMAVRGLEEIRKANG